MKTTRRTLFLLGLLALGACNAMGSGSSDTGGQAAPVGQISGIPLPTGHSVDQGNSLVLGEGDRWTGRYTYTQNSKAADLLDYYRREMPSFGWTEVSVVRAETSVLTFSSAATGRFATVQITPRTLFGSRVSITVSPITGGGGGAMPAPATLGPRSDVQPAPPAVPRDSVTVQPLR